VKSSRRKTRTKARTKQAKKAPGEPLVHIDIVESQFHKLLDRIERRIAMGMAGHGVQRCGVPFTFIPSVTDILGDIALDVQILRHAGKAGTP
jgi:hypothetical protein